MNKDLFIGVANKTGREMMGAVVGTGCMAASVIGAFTGAHSDYAKAAAAENPDEKRRELEQKLMANRSPFPMMESFAVHELIDPRQTRAKLCRWVDWIEPLLEELKGPVTWGMRP